MQSLSFVEVYDARDDDLDKTLRLRVEGGSTDLHAAKARYDFYSNVPLLENNYLCFITFLTGYFIHFSLIYIILILFCDLTQSLNM